MSYSPPVRPDSAHLNTRERFNTPQAATRYLAKKNLQRSRKNRLEIKCLSNALADIPAYSRVLDLPCGAGRLEPMLLARGFQVVAADFSEPMLRVAHDFVLQNTQQGALPGSLRFDRQDVFNTDYNDDQFDVVICNRLLHHFPDADLRRRLFRELARISSRRVIISYFSNFAVSALSFYLGNRIRRHTPDDRVPVWFRTLRQDFNHAGLAFMRRYSVSLGVSPQTYLVLDKAPAAAT